MAYTAVTKPVAGDPVKASTLSGVIDNQADAHSRLQLLEGFGDSFETDGDSDGIPDGWAVATYASGTYTLDATTAVHGAQSFKATTANPGGYVELSHETSQVCPVAVGEHLGFSWFLKCSTAATDPEVEVSVLWYDADDVYVSTDVLFKTGTCQTSTIKLPAAWMLCLREAVVPSTAVYYKLKFRLGSATIAAVLSLWVDQVRVGVHRSTIWAAGNPTLLTASGYNQAFLCRFNAAGPVGFEGYVSPHWVYALPSVTDLTYEDPDGSDDDPAPVTPVEITSWFPSGGALIKCNAHGVFRAESAGTEGWTVTLDGYLG